MTSEGDAVTTGTDRLEGLRLAVGPDVADGAVVSALRGAGAVVVGTTSGGSNAYPVAMVSAGDADIAITADSSGAGLMAAATHGIVGIMPTAGVVSVDGIVPARETHSRITVFASTLLIADRVVAIAAADAPSRRWPADVRLAAPPVPVVAIPDKLSGPDRRSGVEFDAAVGELAARGCRIVTTEGLRLPERAPAGADVLLVPTAPGQPDLRTLFDMCAVTVGDASSAMTVLARAFDDAVAVDIAALIGDSAPTETVWPLAVAEHVELVVFGAHLLGGPLVHQLTDRGARFAGAVTTAPRYRMTALPTTPAKPGVTRVPDGVHGAALTGHRWLLSPAALGQFLAELPAPMQLGKVEFADGSWRTAFGCDGSVQGVDVSSYGSWTNALAAGAVRQT